MKHIHEWRRLKGNRFICGAPTCYEKYQLSSIDGKLAACPVCHNSTFIVDSSSVKESEGTIACPACRGLGIALTLEHQRTLLRQEISREERDLIAKHLRILRAKQRELLSREKQVEKLEDGLRLRSNQLDNANFRLKRQRQVLSDLILKGREGLKAKRAKLDMQFEMRLKKAVSKSPEYKEGMDNLVEEALKYL